MSLRSGRRVADALRSVGVEVEMLRRRRRPARLRWPSTRRTPSFIALHGGPGEDGAVRGVLDLAGIPYVGAEPHACRMAFDKPTAKAVAARGGSRHAGLGHAAARDLPRARRARRARAAALGRLGLPLMVKPAQGGSALGVTVVERRRSGCRRRWCTASPTATPRWSSGSSAGTEVAVVGRRGRRSDARGAAGGRDRAEGRRLRLRRALHRGRDGLLHARPARRPRSPPCPRPRSPRTERWACATCPAAT